jgi:hypothetical protein
VDDRAFPLLERHGHFPAPETPLQLRHPVVQHGRLLLELEMLDRPAGGLQMDRVPLVAPIQSDVRHDIVQLATPPSFRATARLAWVRRKPYSRVLSGHTTRTTSEYAMSDQRASSPLDRPSQTVQRLAKLSRSGDDARISSCHHQQQPQFNRAPRAVENAASVEIHKERGFPQAAWKASLSTFPTSASSFLSPPKTLRNNYRAKRGGHGMSASTAWSQ